MDFVPEVSAINIDSIEVDPETKAMLKAIDLGNLANVSVSTNTYKRAPKKDNAH